MQELTVVLRESSYHGGWIRSFCGLNLALRPYVRDSALGRGAVFLGWSTRYSFLNFESKGPTLIAILLAVSIFCQLKVS